MASLRQRRCLVTGASGFIGTALVPLLAAHGWDVWATTTSGPRSTAAQWLTWDARREAVPPAPWDELDGIVHLAAPAGAIVETTVALLDRAAAAGVPRFVNVSSGDALGRPPHIPDERTEAGSATSPYGAAKATAERLVQEVAPMTGVSVRLFHPYGPGGDRFLVNRLIAAVAEGAPVTVEGAEGIPLNPVWVADVVEGLRLALESEATGVLHLGGPDELTLLALLTMISDLVGRPPVIHRVDAVPVLSHAGRWAETAAQIGYAPRTSLRKGVATLVNALDVQRGDSS